MYKKKLEAIVKEGTFETYKTIDIWINDGIDKRYLLDDKFNHTVSFYEELKKLQALGYTIIFQ